MGKSKRYEAIDGLRTFSCIGIVAMHVFGNSKFNVSGYVFERIIPSFTNLVFLFMTISAFGMCCGYYDRMINKQIDIVDFYKKRYRKILPFFALLSCLELLLSPSLNSLYETFANLTLCFGFIPNANITVIGVGWFLGIVFAFYLVFPFFCFLISDKRKAWVSAIAALIMNYLCKVYFDADRKTLVFSFVYFMVGGMVFLYKDQLEGKKIKIVSIIVLVASVLLYYWIRLGTVAIILINCTLLILSLNVRNKGILINKFTRFIGGISFEIYLCHMLVFRVIEKLHLLRITENEYVNYWLITIVVFASAVLAAYIGKKIVEIISRTIEKRFTYKKEDI